MFTEQTLHSNPSMTAALSPYLTRYQRFIFTSVILIDTSVHPLTLSSYACEMLLVVSRLSNTLPIQIWNESVGANIGIPLQPGDVFEQRVDNMIWDFTEALITVFGQPGQTNPLPRRTIDTATWKVLNATATTPAQVLDIALGIGPSNE